MTVPEQIRKQSEAVDQFYASMEAQEPESGEPAASTEGIAEPVASDESASAPPSPSADQSEETYEQRYRTLQGMYNAEVPTLRKQVKEQTQRLQQLEQLLAAAPAPSGQSEPEAYTPKTYVSTNEVEEYGGSIDVMRKVSKEELDPMAYELQQLREQVQSLQTTVLPQVESVVQQQTASAEQIFWAELSRSVPNWQEINANPDFHTWLLETDPLTGQTRQAYLEQAQQESNPTRAASFFTTWQSLQAQPVSAAPTRTSSELERQVAPGRTRGPAPSVDSEKPQYSRADIAQFFDDVRSGKYRGREKDRDRTERDIFAAQREGRIV